MKEKTNMFLFIHKRREAKGDNKEYKRSLFFPIDDALKKQTCFFLAMQRTLSYCAYIFMSRRTIKSIDFQLSLSFFVVKGMYIFISKIYKKKGGKSMTVD